jgi:hypothetical protein
MFARIWLFAIFLIPIIVCWQRGTNYIFAFSLLGVGIALYLLSNLLMIAFINKRAPGSIQNGTWEDTAGTGIVPKWVSEIGLLGTGFVPSAIAILILLWFGFFHA